MSIVFAALAWMNTPGRRLDLSIGASRTSIVGRRVAPMNTILFRNRAGFIVPFKTSSAEISSGGSESFAVQFTIMLVVASAGMKRLPAWTPFFRTIGGALSPRAAVNAATDNAGTKSPLMSKTNGRLRTTPSFGSWVTCTCPTPAAPSANAALTPLAVPGFAVGGPDPVARVVGRLGKHDVAGSLNRVGELAVAVRVGCPTGLRRRRRRR